MKFGNIYYPYGSLYKKDREGVEKVNIGDTFQYLAIENLYQYMGVTDIIKVNRYELADWDKEYLVLPINCLFSGYTNNMNMTNFSDKIIPVFLGFGIRTTFLSETDVRYLKRYEPIGCRDEFTFRVLKQYGIDCWLNGCMTLCFPQRKAEGQETIYLVDVPDAVKEYMPNFENVKSLSHIWDNDIENIEKAVAELYNEYIDRAKMIVTSRLHCALPAIAAGIPVVLVKDRFETTFAWVEKIITKYDETAYSRINWNPDVIDVSKIKRLMLENAKQMIMTTVQKYDKRIRLTEFYESKKKIEIVNEAYSNIIMQLDKAWDKNEKKKYAIWGFSQISDAVVTWIDKNYPHAELVAIYDKYRFFSYRDIKSQKLENIGKLSDTDILIMGSASCEAYRSKQVDCGKNQIFCCY